MEIVKAFDFRNGDNTTLNQDLEMMLLGTGWLAVFLHNVCHAVFHEKPNFDTPFYFKKQ
jgi:hypothetical protein